MGLLKHALILAFYCLIKVEQDYSKDLTKGFDFAMRQTLMLAGDTDTNCAIVGGLIGAYVGVKNIDQSKVKKVLECDVKAGETIDRAEYIQVKNGGFE